MGEEIQVQTPYADVDWDTCRRSRAQFHTHTNRRRTEEDHNGSADANEIVDFHAGRGYDVLALGDHEGAVESVTWPWPDLSALVEGWEDRYPIGTHAGAGPDDETVELVAVEGIELGRGHEPEDMVCLFSDLSASPSGDNVAVLEAVAERGGIAWAAHPGRYATSDEWGDRWLRDALARVDACLGLEVYNRGYDVEAAAGIWDAALTEFMPDRSVWGFAGDDMHSTDPDAYPQAWQTLYVDELSRPAVREALESGRSTAHLVYDSTGEPAPPTLHALTVDGDGGRVSLDASDYDSVRWISRGETVGTDPAIRVEPDHAPYLRAVLENAAGETSTQPIAVRA